MRSSIATLLLRLLLVAGSSFVGLAALEVGLRATKLQPDFFFQPDAEVGAIHIPGKKGWFAFKGGRQHIEINAHGYRDRERSFEKPPGTFRIALLGDSFVEAFQVAEDETLAARLERSLNLDCATSGTRFEVLNFGVSGFGTAQELETLRHRARKFDPDFVLLNFYASNDLYDNSRELDVEPNRLHYALDADGELSRLPFRISDNPVKRWLRAHSQAYLFLRERLKTVSALRKALTVVSLMQEEVTAETEQSARHALGGVQYLRELPPAVQRSWQLTEALLGEIRAEAREQSAGFALVVTPNKEEILSRAASPDSTAGPDHDFQQSLARIDDICQRLGIRCLQLVDAFVGKPIDELYLSRDGHWTSEGHALAATAVFDWLSGSGAVTCSDAGRSPGT